MLCPPHQADDDWLGSGFGYIYIYVSSGPFKHSAHVPAVAYLACCIDCTVYTSNLCVPVPWRRLIKARLRGFVAWFLQVPPSLRRWCEFVELNHAPVFCCFLARVLFFPRQFLVCFIFGTLAANFISILSRTCLGVGESFENIIITRVRKFMRKHFYWSANAPETASLDPRRSSQRGFRLYGSLQGVDVAGLVSVGIYTYPGCDADDDRGKTTQTTSAAATNLGPGSARYDDGVDSHDLGNSRRIRAVWDVTLSSTNRYDFWNAVF